MDKSPSLIINYKENIGKWHEVFKNNNPIYIEIGMGKGKFIIENALNNPDINYIGIEKYDSVVARALEKIKEVIPNLVIIRMNALEIDEVFSKEVSKIFLNFSDPWPKARHSDRRLTSHIFLKKYDNIFIGDRSIRVRTDNMHLFEYSIESLSNYGYKLKDIYLDLHNEKEEVFITTEYEDRFHKKGQPIYQLDAFKDLSNFDKIK